MSPPPDRSVAALAGARVLVTGGLGFIGSAVVRRLAADGAEVVVVDALVPEHGGDRHNLDDLPAGGSAEVVVADIGDASVADLLVDTDIVFNLAGQVSHLASMQDPLRDLDLNVRAHVQFLELVRLHAPTARVILTSTRQVYGRPHYLPVDEDHPTIPVDVNGIDKLACERYHLLYGSRYDLRTIVLRLTNVYGPRQHLERDDLGFLPVFVRRALLGEEIVLFGDGSQQRDCVHVDDVVDAMLLAAGTPEATGEIFNLGHPDLLSLATIAGLTQAAAGRGGTTRRVPWPEELVPIDIGSFQGDFSKAKRLLGWAPRVLRRRHPVDHRPLRRPVVVPLVDLTRRHRRFGDAFELAVRRVLQSGTVLLGPELAALERELGPALHRAGSSADGVVAVASGASGLQLALAGLGVGPGDEVIVPAFTAVPTASAVCAVGAIPVPVDVDVDTASLDPVAVGRAITDRTRAIIVVHLYGRPAPVAPLLAFGVPVVEDAAQAHGALCSVTGAAAVYSFYPTKNIGGIGDGGAVVTADGELAETVRRLRAHGMTEQYVHVDISQNHRMSELEAAWLRLQLPELPADNERRRAIARNYREAAPALAWQLDHADHVVHQCVVRVADRDRVRAALLERGVATGVHYPRTIGQQPAYAAFARSDCPVADAWAATCVSLPCSPDLRDDEVALVASALEGVDA